jgi:serine/threonine protein kinase
MATPSDENGMLMRDVKFPCLDVTVVERIDTVGSSLSYTAEEKARDHVSTSTSRRKFRIKVTVATTQEQARRAAAEVLTLRRIPEHLNILKLIDSGCSAVDQGIREHVEHDSEPLEEKRLYCLLFKDCPSRTVRDIMEKQRIKFIQNSNGTSNGSSQRAQNSGWMKIENVMGIFRQMADAVSVLHTTNETRAIHLDLRPDHFCAYKTSSETKMGCNYIVKLIGAGCAVDGCMSLASTSDRKRAALLINSRTTLRYRAPEMVNLLLADKLTDK